ncbi:MAG: hypothetical protein EXQ81_08140 [Thermoleophilia bacterium]|nr:hypothetical protein [Thermoleophilia bacterium]
MQGCPAWRGHYLYPLKPGLKWNKWNIRVFMRVRAGREVEHLGRVPLRWAYGGSRPFRRRRATLRGGQLHVVNGPSAVSRPTEPPRVCARGPHPPRGTDAAGSLLSGTCRVYRFKTLYKRRSAVEREFGRLKHEYGLAFLRARGIERVRLHADLVMLGRLAQALSRARESALAA